MVMPESIQAANKIQTRKTFVLYFYAVSLYVLVQMYMLSGLPTQPVVAVLSKLAPSLANAPQPDTAAFVIYFGLAILLTPVAIFYYCKDDVLHERWRYGILRNRSVDIKRVLFMYFILIPVMYGLLYVAFNVPSRAYTGSVYTAGAKGLQAMAHHWWALLIYGPFFALGLWLWFWMPIVLFSFIKLNK